MKVKLFSVQADENFYAVRVGNETRKLSANEYLEDKIQKFLDENPKVQIKHVQFGTVAIIPKTASWSTTNADIDWETEKSVLILYDE